MAEIKLPLPGLSAVNGKALSARFDGGALTSDAGLLALREVVLRLDVAGRLAAGIDDPRDPTRTVHSVADILRFRMLLIAAGYEDGIDANALRVDPAFKLALGRLPGERDLSSQSTISRLENLPDRRMLLRLARGMVGLYCASFAQVPKRITLDIDDTFDAVHGGEPPWVSRRLLLVRKGSSWKSNGRAGNFPMRFASGRCAWFARVKVAISRGGRRWCRCPARSAARPRRCGVGSGRPRSTLACALA
jgi:hypothetical protein